MKSESEVVYLDSLRLFKNVCTNIPENLEYVKGAILGPKKEKLARAYIDRVIHIGNTTTSKVEAAHIRVISI